MKALSWKEPYASMMLHGKIETRTWHTPYRGLVLLCASKQPYNDGQIKRISGFYQAGRISQFVTPYSYSSGHAFALGELVDCRPMTPTDSDKCFVDYRPGLYCHVYKNVHAIKPLAWRGALGWQAVPQHIIDEIVKTNHHVITTNYPKYIGHEQNRNQLLQHRSAQLGLFDVCPPFSATGLFSKNKTA